jgi:hypothetical protein
MTEPIHGASPARRSFRALGGLAGGVLVLVLVRSQGGPELLSVLRGGRPGTVLVALGLAILVTLTVAWELSRVYSGLGGTYRSRLDLVVEAAEVDLLNFLVPLAGSARRIAGAGRHHDLRAPDLARGLGMLFASRLLVASAATLVGVATLGPGPAGVALGIAVAVLLVVHGGRHRLFGWAPLARLVGSLLPIAVMRLLLVAARLGVLVAASGVDPSPPVLVGAAGLTALSMAIPFLPAGLGARESAFMVAADWLGMTLAEGLAVALLDRALILAASAVTFLIGSAARTIPHRVR